MRRERDERAYATRPGEGDRRNEVGPRPYASLKSRTWRGAGAMGLNAVGSAARFDLGLARMTRPRSEVAADQGLRTTEV